MIAIIDTRTGNVGSIANMLKKIGVEAAVTREPDAIARADKLVLPGVGAFDAGMESLEASGLRPLLERRVLEEKVPILGLCLGLQLFTRRSAEGNRPGLGWIEGETVRFQIAADRGLKIPHMGWNTIETPAAHALWEGMPPSPKFYFVHSYHVVCADAAATIATTEHGYRFTCAAARGNIMGVQFHPEKSHKYGMQLFRNFARLPAR
jgi:glutamine amidotransferase